MDRITASRPSPPARKSSRYVWSELADALAVITSEACVAALDRPAATPPTAASHCSGWTGGGPAVLVSLISWSSSPVRAVDACGLMSWV